MLVSSIISVNTECNSRCNSCDFWKNKNISLSFEEITEFVNHFKKLDQVMISGGEPLLYHNLKEILLFLKNKNIQIMLNTNGILLNEIKAEIFDNIYHIIISLDSSTREGYLKLRGVDKFEQVIDNIKYIKAKFPKIIITLRTTIMKGNLLDIFNIQKLSVLLQCRHSLNPVDAFSNNFNRKREIRYDLIPDILELKKFLTIMKQEKIFNTEREKNATWTKQKFVKLVNYFYRLQKNKLDIKLDNECIVPWTTLLLEANGDVKRCFYSEVIGNIKNTSFILEEKLTQESITTEIKDLKNAKKCLDCRTKLFC